MFVQRAHDDRSSPVRQLLLTDTDHPSGPVKDLPLLFRGQLSHPLPQVGPFDRGVMEKIRVTAIVRTP